MRPVRTFILAAVGAATLWGQQFQIDLDYLKDKASDAVDLSLNSDTLQLAGRFLNGKDPDEAKVKKLIMGIAGIYIKSFEFKTAGAYAAADLEKIRTQLKAPEWSRIVGVKSEGNENTEIWMRMDKGKIAGVAILSSEPRRITVANLVGNIDLDSLSDLGGRFGLPSMGKKK